MSQRTRMIALAILAFVASSAPARAAADLTASYDGRIVIAGSHEAVAVALALTAAGTVVSGTLAVGPIDGETFAPFALHGHVAGRRVKLVGASADGARLAWIGRIASSGLVGRVRIRRRAVRRRGRMRVDRRAVVPPGGGQACDNTYFTTEVMPKVLVPICAHCHVEGGQAGSTSFRVTPSDALATQASVAVQIDASDPVASRILRKPLGELPHGGGQRIVAGSPEEAILRHWVDLVAQGVCGGGGGGGGTPEERLYADNCASCHGADARGLDGRPDIRCAVHILDPVRFGRGTGDGAMPPFDNLSDADVATIQRHLRDLCDASGRAGVDLFTSNCAGCHGADARGLAGTPNVRCAVDVRDAVRAGRDGGAMPAFLATELSTADVTNVQAYLDGLCTASGPSRPGDLYLSNCAGCHGPTAAGATNSAGVHGPNVQCTETGDFLDAVRSGEDAMPAFPRLTNADVSTIAGYVHGFCTP
jgi:mono/diheme cytochrome c family protein